jgi:hypothetical protein
MNDAILMEVCQSAQDVASAPSDEMEIVNVTVIVDQLKESGLGKIDK